MHEPSAPLSLIYAIGFMIFLYGTGSAYAAFFIQRCAPIAIFPLKGFTINATIVR